MAPRLTEPLTRCANMPGMCGRYASFLPPEAVARFFRTTNTLPNFGPSWNVAPSQQAMVVRRHPETGERHLDLLQWRLVPHWTKEPAQARRPINAKAETIATSPMFCQAFAKRRALVPAGRNRSYSRNPPWCTNPWEFDCRLVRAG
jgi:putative SOS response-associated peptidase YedK